jgi:hypothetical protein
MRHPDAERPNGPGHPMPMVMVLLLAVAMQVDMRAVIMVVTVDMPSFPVQFPRQCAAKGDQQKSHAGLRDDFKPFGDANVPCQNHRPDEQESRCMANPPPKSNGAGCPKRGPFSQHRRDRRKMVSIERMPQAEQEPEPQNRGIGWIAHRTAQLDLD